MHPFQVFQQLLAESGPIRHAIVKDIIGPNSFFVSQSGTDSRKFGADIPESAGKDKAARAQAILEEAIGAHKASDARLGFVYRLLGSLGSHDLSFMREALGGKPDKCSSAFASHDGMFISAAFEYSNRALTRATTSTRCYIRPVIHAVGVLSPTSKSGRTRGFSESTSIRRTSRGCRSTSRSRRTTRTVTIRNASFAPTYQDAYTTEFLGPASSVDFRQGS